MAEPSRPPPYHQAQLLLSTIELVSRAEDPAAALPEVLAKIAELLPCDRLAAFEYDEGAGGFRLGAHFGLTPASLAILREQVFPYGQPFGGIVSGGGVVAANSIEAQQWLSEELCRLAEIGAYVAVPMRARGAHHGALVAARATALQPFTQEEVELLTGLGRQIALAVETKLLLAAQRRQAERAQALSHVSRSVLQNASGQGLDELCRLTCLYTGCDFSHLWLWQPEERRFTLLGGFGESPEEREVMQALSLNPPLAEVWRETLRRGTAVLLPGDRLPVAFPLLPLAEEEGAPRYIAPLFDRGELTGFQATGRRRARPLTADQLALLDGIAQTASLALDQVRALQVLEQANRMKSDFVAAISHELRTPLNVILGYCDLLLDRAFGELTDEQSDVLGRLQVRARELADLIANTLDFNRLEAGQMQVQCTDVRIADVLTPVLQELRHLHNPDRVLLITELPDHAPFYTDPGKLRLILKNLIGNALKFTQEGEVRVCVRKTERLCRIEVQDTGIGIPPEALPTIFEPYRQAHDHAGQSFGGVGLGLFIVHRLVHMLGGSIQVRSELQRGTTFTVLLPDNRS